MHMNLQCYEISFQIISMIKIYNFFYLDSRYYSPERHSRSHRDRSPGRERYERDRYNDTYHRQSGQPRHSLHHAHSSSNLTNPDGLHRRVSNDQCENTV